MVHPKSGREYIRAVHWGIMSIHAGAALGLGCWCWGLVYFPRWAMVQMFSVFAFAIATGLGVTVVYHRCITHGGFTFVKEWYRRCGVVWGAMHGQQLAKWVRNHRLHHAFVDTEDDPHPPGVYGFFFAHMGWLWYQYKPPQNAPRYLDLETDPIYNWERRWHIYFLLAGFIIPALMLVGMQALVWGGSPYTLVKVGVYGILLGMVRMSIALHATFAVNSFGHSRPRPHADKNDSWNVWWLIVALGEQFHRNHHDDEDSAFHGWERWDFDPTKWLILVLERRGIITDVRRPRAWGFPQTA